MDDMKTCITTITVAAKEKRKSAIVIGIQIYESEINMENQKT